MCEDLFMELDKLHKFPVDRRGFEQLVRIAKAYYLFIYLSPETEKTSRKYFESLLKENQTFGNSIRHALQKRDKYFSALEIVARYIVFGNLKLERVFTLEQEKEAKNKAMIGYKKLLELLLPE